MLGPCPDGKRLGGRRSSPARVPFPGTPTVAHLEDNLAAAAIELTDEQFERLAEAAG
jgi:pyridoxine 4-dehydrogenase